MIEFWEGLVVVEGFEAACARLRVLGLLGKTKASKEEALDKAGDVMEEDMTPFVVVME